MFTLKNDQLELAFPELHRDARLVIEFQRTLRIPDDNSSLPPSPGLGQFPMRHVDDYAAKVPSKWREHGGVFPPMYQAEALWISFRSAQGYPFAVKIAAGKMNAVSGTSWTNDLDFDDQDYVVVPDPALARSALRQQGEDPPIRGDAPWRRIHRRRTAHRRSRARGYSNHRLSAEARALRPATEPRGINVDGVRRALRLLCLGSARDGPCARWRHGAAHLRG